MLELWEHLGERYRELPGPWWAVFGIYETLIVGAWLLEHLLLRRIRAVSGDPIDAQRRDRSYRGWWVWHFLALQFPLYRTGRWSTIFPQTWTTVSIGTTIAVAGLALRLHAIWCLREYFSYVVYVGKHHHLVTRGPYRLVRHPAYLGLIVFFLGLPIVVCDGWSILVTMGYVGTIVALRIVREERELKSLFGAEYEAWRRRTKLLIPYLL